ncbi:MAG: ABC transporter ATP-binding protein, partial [Clostridiaceae bacterium]|nr:ABC transporter ATP-binding protein [Clostridiaceae bacterium]
TMSKGMQEKLQLTLVMSRRARIYLLDEPMGGVDPAARSAILEVVLRNYQDDALMVLATHLIYDVERIFDEVLMMGFGQVIMQGETDQLRAQYGKSIDDIFREVFRCSAN